MIRPRFSLRTLLIAFTAICILLGSVMVWYRTQKAEYQRQLELGNKLQAEGASLGWESQAPKWLSWLGDSSQFRRIIGIYGWQPESISDDQWTWLSGLKEVTINVPANLLDDEMVARFAKLKPLKELMVLPPLLGDDSVSEHDYHFGLQPEISSKLPGVHVVLGKAWHKTPLLGDTLKDAKSN